MTAAGPAIVDGCSYCGRTGDQPTCCPAHPLTGMCTHCRIVPGRPDWHNSPIEGRACCGRKNWTSTCNVCAGAL